MDGKYGKIEDYIPEGSVGVAIKFSPSNTVTWTPKDFVNFNSKLSKYVTMTNDNFDSGGGTASMIYDDKKAKAELTSKEYYLYEAYKASRSSRNSAQQTLADNIQKYRLQVNQPFQRVIAQRSEEENKLITERTVAMQGKRYGIPLANEAQKTSFGNVLLEFADLADSQNGALALSPDVTASELRDVAVDIQNANIETVEATKFAPARYKITATNKDKKTVTFNMTPEQYASVTKGKFDADPNILAIRDLEAQQIRAGGGTTSLDGEKTNVGNAFMGNSLNFINVRHYSVSGNLVTNQNGLSSIRLNISDPTTGEVIVEDLGYPRGGLIEKNKVNAAMQGLTDQTIFEMLYNRKPTAAELKKLQQ
jgi:hypothetical protein